MSTRESISATGRVVLITIFVWLIWLALLFALCSCSDISRIRSAEAKQTAAMVKTGKAVAKKQADTVKRDADQKAKEGAVANLATQVKFLLSLPETSKTIPVADQLLDEQLTMTGAPTERESVLEAEVRDLMASDQKNQETIARIQKQDADKDAVLNTANQKLVADDQVISDDKAEIVKTTTKLYSAAELFAGKADELSGWINTLWTVAIVIVVLGGGLFAFYLFTKFGIKTAEATTAVAAKVP